MVFYKDTLSNGTPGDCQESNILIPSRLLLEAESDGVPFVFLSRATVFDMSRNRVYNEKSIVNGSCVAGKTMSIMEKRVLDYEHGYVIRSCNILSDIIEEIRDMSVEFPESISPRVIRPVSMKVIDYIADLVHGASWEGRERVVHVPLMQMHSLASIIYRIAGRESEFEVSEEGVDISEKYDAVLDSSCFDDVFSNLVRLDCIYVNDFFVNMELYGEQKL